MRQSLPVLLNSIRHPHSPEKAKVFFVLSLMSSSQTLHSFYGRRHHKEDVWG